MKKNDKSTGKQVNIKEELLSLLEEKKDQNAALQKLIRELAKVPDDNS